MDETVRDEEDPLFKNWWQAFYRFAQIDGRLASYTFENFTASNRQQRQAVAFCKAFAEDAVRLINVKNSDEDAWPQSDSRFPNLLLLGTCGTGKTHLAVATAKRIAWRAGCMGNVRIYRWARLVTEWRSTWGVKVSYPRKEEEDHLVTEEDLREELKDREIVIFDDIPEHLSDNERAFMTEVVNDRYEHKLGHIITSNATLKQFAQIVGDRVYDRLIEGGRSAVLDGESYRQKVPAFPVPEVSKA